MMPSMPKDLSMYMPLAAKAAQGMAALFPMGCAAPTMYTDPNAPKPDDIVWKKGESACYAIGNATIPVQMTEDVPRHAMATNVVRTDTGKVINVPTSNLLDQDYCRQ